MKVVMSFLEGYVNGIVSVQFFEAGFFQFNVFEIHSSCFMDQVCSFSLLNSVPFTVCTYNNLFIHLRVQEQCSCFEFLAIDFCFILRVNTQR